MNSEVFRGKDFSNTIELSQLIQDLFTVSDLGSLQFVGKGKMGVGASGAWGATRHAHTCVLKCTHMKCYNQHVRKLQMASTMEAAMFIMFNTCMCVCTHVCTCMHVHVCVHVCWGCLQTPSPQTTHPPPGGTPHNQ